MLYFPFTSDCIRSSDSISPLLRRRDAPRHSGATPGVCVSRYWRKGSGIIFHASPPLVLSLLIWRQDRRLEGGRTGVVLPQKKGGENIESWSYYKFLLHVEQNIYIHCFVSTSILLRRNKSGQRFDIRCNIYWIVWWVRWLRFL